MAAGERIANFLPPRFREDYTKNLQRIGKSHSTMRYDLPNRRKVFMTGLHVPVFENYMLAGFKIIGFMTKEK